MLTARLTAKKGGLAGARVVREGQELIFISQSGMVQRNAVEGISRMGRATQGVRVMNLKKGDRVSAVALVVESENGSGNGNGAAAKAPTLEDDAPDAATVAEEAAAVEAAGNGEPKVTKAPRRRSSGSDAPASAPAKRRTAPKPAKEAAPRPAKKAAPKPKASKPRVKPKPTATAKQRAESERRKRKS
jgi:DNA gyrase C-terminal domain, beta-propeller